MLMVLAIKPSLKMKELDCLGVILQRNLANLVNMEDHKLFMNYYF